MHKHAYKIFWLAVTAPAAQINNTGKLISRIWMLYSPYSGRWQIFLREPCKSQMQKAIIVLRVDLKSHISHSDNMQSFKFSLHGASPAILSQVQYYGTQKFFVAKDIPQIICNLSNFPWGFSSRKPAKSEFLSTVISEKCLEWNFD